MKMRLTVWMFAVVVFGSCTLLGVVGCGSVKPPVRFVRGTSQDHPRGIKELPVLLAVSLEDGSRLIGETTLTGLPMRSDVLGKFEIPLDKIRTVMFSRGHESVTVTFGKGDQVSGELRAVAVTMQTLCGRVRVPLEKTTAIAILRGGAKLVRQNSLSFPADREGTITPAFDITGYWMSEDGIAAFYQQGMEVQFIYDNNSFGQYFIGTYVTPKTIEGIQYRRNLANQCVTKMSLKFEILSKNTMRLEWVALDSECDLTSGQGGIRNVRRVSNRIRAD